MRQRKLELLRERASRWRPLPGPQTTAFTSLADVTGYGGAAGGGKSDLLIGLASTQHRRAIIFRREATQNDDLYDRAKEIVRASHFNDTKKWARIGERKVEFAGVKDPNDVLKWRGRPHDFIGFDEGTEFLEKQVRFLSGWLRTTKKGQRCRIVLTFNPPTTAEGRWVIKYFAPWLDKNYPGKRAMPGELRWFAMVDGKEVERENAEPFIHNGRKVTPISRTFIPARLDDNPYLQATDYGRQLDALPEPLRSQLLYGDFEAGVEDDPWQVIPTAWLDAAIERWKKGKRPTGDSPFTPRKPNDPPPTGKVDTYGADIARGGKDRTTFAPKVENWFDPILVFLGSVTDTGMRVVELMTVQPDASEAAWHVDVIGVGSSAYDIATQNGFNAVAMNASEGSEARDKSGSLRFANKRAEWYWKLRESLDPSSGRDLAIPDDPELRQDLTAPRWKLVGRGIQIEPKSDIAERIGRSPDKGDALVYANAEPSGPGYNQLEALRRMAESNRPNGTS